MIDSIVSLYIKQVNQDQTQKLSDVISEMKLEKEQMVNEINYLLQREHHLTQAESKLLLIYLCFEIDDDDKNYCLYCNSLMY